MDGGAAAASGAVRTNATAASAGAGTGTGTGSGNGAGGGGGGGGGGADSNRSGRTLTGLDSPPLSRRSMRAAAAAAALNSAGGGGGGTSTNAAAGSGVNTPTAAADEVTEPDTGDLRRLRLQHSAGAQQLPQPAAASASARVSASAGTAATVIATGAGTGPRLLAASSTVGASTGIGTGTGATSDRMHHFSPPPAPIVHHSLIGGAGSMDFDLTNDRPTSAGGGTMTPTATGMASTRGGGGGALLMRSGSGIAPDTPMAAAGTAVIRTTGAIGSPIHELPTASDRMAVTPGSVNHPPPSAGGLMARRGSRTQIGSVVVTVNGRGLGLNKHHTAGGGGGSGGGGGAHHTHDGSSVGTARRGSFSSGKLRREYVAEKTNSGVWAHLPACCQPLRPVIRIVFAAIFFLLVIGVILWLFVWQRNAQLAADRADFIHDCEFGTAVVGTFLRTSLTTLSGVRALFESSGPDPSNRPSSVQFEQYWTALRKQTDDPVTMMAYAPFINGTDRPGWEQTYGPLQYFMLQNPDGILRLLPQYAERNTYLPLLYVVPENAFGGPTNVTSPVGLDILSSLQTLPAWSGVDSDALGLAIETNGGVFAIPIGESESGIAVLLPVHEREPRDGDTGGRTVTRTSNSNPTIGTILGVFSVSSLLSRAVVESSQQKLQLSLAAGSVIASTRPNETPVPVDTSDEYNYPIRFTFSGTDFIMQCGRTVPFDFDQPALYSTTSILVIFSFAAFLFTYRSLRATRDLRHQIRLKDQINAELHDSNHKKDTAQRVADAANRSKSNLMSFICHELRNPLHIQNAMIDLLQETNDERSAEERDHLNTIRSNTDLMLFIVNDVLDINRIDDGKMRFESLSFNLHTFVNGLAHAHAPAAHTRRIRLSVAIDPRVPQYVIGDYNRCRQVLTNLLTNAIKFTKNGTVKLGVTVRPAHTPAADGGTPSPAPAPGTVAVAGSGPGASSTSAPASPGTMPAPTSVTSTQPLVLPAIAAVTAATVTASAGGVASLRPGTPLGTKGVAAIAAAVPQSVHLEFFVEDSGIGIAPEVLTHLFTPFEQGSAHIAREYGGSGLGLSIVHRIVGLMGGSVSVESQLGHGSVFRVRLSLPIASGPSSNAAGASNDFKVWSNPAVAAAAAKAKAAVAARQQQLLYANHHSPSLIGSPGAGSAPSMSNITPPLHHKQHGLITVPPPSADVGISALPAPAIPFGLGLNTSGAAQPVSMTSSSTSVSRSGAPSGGTLFVAGSGGGAGAGSGTSGTAVTAFTTATGSPSNASNASNASASGIAAAAAAAQNAAHLRLQQPIRRTLSVGPPIGPTTPIASGPAPVYVVGTGTGTDEVQYTPPAALNNPQLFHYNTAGTANARPAATPGTLSVAVPTHPRMSAVMGSFTPSQSGAVSVHGSGARDSTFSTPLAENNIALLVTDGGVVGSPMMGSLNSGAPLTGTGATYSTSQRNRLLISSTPTHQSAATTPQNGGGMEMVTLPGQMAGENSPPEVVHLPLGGFAQQPAPTTVTAAAAPTNAAAAGPHAPQLAPLRPVGTSTRNQLVPLPNVPVSGGAQSQTSSASPNSGAFDSAAAVQLAAGVTPTPPVPASDMVYSLPSTNAIRLSRNPPTNIAVPAAAVVSPSMMSVSGHGHTSLTSPPMSGASPSVQSSNHIAQTISPGGWHSHPDTGAHPSALALPPSSGEVSVAFTAAPLPVLSGPPAIPMSLAGRAAAGLNIGVELPNVPHILIVDDNAPNCMVLARMLKEFSTYVAYNGKQAIEAVSQAIQVRNRPFELILMDINMPIMDGWTAVRTLRSMGVTVPIVALTANALIEDQQKCVSAGFDGYMSKPFNKNDILKLVAAMIPSAAGVVTAAAATQAGHTPTSATAAAHAMLVTSNTPPPLPASSLPLDSKVANTPSSHSHSSGTASTGVSVGVTASSSPASHLVSTGTAAAGTHATAAGATATTATASGPPSS